MSNGLNKQWEFLGNNPTFRGLPLSGGMVRIPFTLAVSINAGGTQATVTESAISSFSAYSIYFVDTKGATSAVGVISAISTPVNISTAALDPTVAWAMIVTLQQVNGSNPDMAKNDASFFVEIAVPKSFSQTYNNAEGQGTPSAKVDGTTVADTGTYTYAGTVNVGDVVVLPITILNTATAANGGFLLTGVSISGDGTFASQGIPNVLIAPEAETNAWSVQLTAASAGAKTATVVFTSSRSSNVSYTFDITFTVS